MLPAAALVAAAFPLLQSMLLLLAQFCMYHYDTKYGAADLDIARVGACEGFQPALLPRVPLVLAKRALPADQPTPHVLLGARRSHGSGGPLQ